jgi:hypothetical protein
MTTCASRCAISAPNGTPSRRDAAEPSERRRREYGQAAPQDRRKGVPSGRPCGLSVVAEGVGGPVRPPPRRQTREDRRESPRCRSVISTTARGLAAAVAVAVATAGTGSRTRRQRRSCQAVSWRAVPRGRGAGLAGRPTGGPHGNRRRTAPDVSDRWPTGSVVGRPAAEPPDDWPARGAQAATSGQHLL